MSNTIGTTQDLDSGRKEALQGLVNSLGHVNDCHKSYSDARLSAEQLKTITEKIDEILEDGTDRDQTGRDQPNQLLNEDDLPIIDISEPINQDSQTSVPSLIPEQDLIPLSLLPPDERERRRREHDRILNLLEEEERLQQLQEEKTAEEERKEVIRKRKESAKAELKQLKAARELQRKMGRVLVRHADGGVENRQDEDTTLKLEVTSSISTTKKCVSFADAPTVEADEKDQQMSANQPDWSDVTLGRLRAPNRLPLVSTAEAQKHPMKIHVVERRPVAPPISPIHNDGDSDDESFTTEYLPSHGEHDSSNWGGSSSSDNNLLDDEPMEDGLDFNVAQHYRDIAFEYHKKRHAIGVESAKAMAAHALDDYERHETPLSRFRADRMVAAYDKSQGPISISMGQTILPASRQILLRDSLRLGNLEDDRLVGGDSGASGSEDEAMREVIQMLRTGDIHNVGPDFNPSSVSTGHQILDAEESTMVGTSTTCAAKPSRFKLARGEVAKRTDFQDNGSMDDVQSQSVISGIVERKAPRSSPSKYFPINKTTQSPVRAAELAPPTIIDSPSFPITRG